MFPLPRVIYAISSDGLLFKFLSTVRERSKTPLIATGLSGVFAGNRKTDKTLGYKSSAEHEIYSAHEC